MAKYFRDYGWEPVIFTAGQAHYPSIDESNFKDVPEGAEILRQRIWEPYHIYKLLTGKEKDANVNNVFYVQEERQSWTHRLSVWIRSNFFIPDARSLWIRPSVRYLCQYLKDHPVDAILSSGPPHSATRIGTLVKKKTGIPWLADFRDPWTQIDYYQQLSLTAWGDARHRRMEQEAFRQADRITIVSPSWKRDLEALGAERVHVITNGFDPDDFPIGEQRVGGQFTLTHLGIMGYDRNPEVLFQVLAKLCEEREGFRQNLRLQLVGQVDQSVMDGCRAYGLEGQVVLMGNVPRQAALDLTRSSPILLLLLNQQSNAEGRIPGKLFEYLAARRPILCLQPVQSDVADILTETGAGTACLYEDADAIKAALLELYAKYEAGQLQSPVDADVEAYSIRRLTGEMAGLLEGMI
jgi:glycosyltransferase involved in cell wall biosynthesis